MQKSRNLSEGGSAPLDPLLDILHEFTYTSICQVIHKTMTVHRHTDVGTLTLTQLDVNGTKLASAKIILLPGDGLGWSCNQYYQLYCQQVVSLDLEL